LGIKKLKISRIVADFAVSVESIVSFALFKSFWCFLHDLRLKLRRLFTRLLFDLFYSIFVFSFVASPSGDTAGLPLSEAHGTPRNLNSLFKYYVSAASCQATTRWLKNSELGYKIRSLSYLYAT